jgi:hypothetical protein
MAEVRWTLQAAEDLEVITDFIAGDSVHYASAVELIKVMVIALPIITVIGISLYVLRHFNRES